MNIQLTLTLYNCRHYQDPTFPAGQTSQMPSVCWAHSANEPIMVCLNQMLKLGLPLITK